MKIVLKNQETRKSNSGNTTKYFRLEKRTRQGDPISAYLFILVLGIVFLSIKGNKNINVLTYVTTNTHHMLTHLILKDKESLIKVRKSLTNFNLFLV